MGIPAAERRLDLPGGQRSSPRSRRYYELSSPPYLTCVLVLQVRSAWSARLYAGRRGSWDYVRSSRPLLSFFSLSARDWRSLCKPWPFTACTQGSTEAQRVGKK